MGSLLNILVPILAVFLVYKLFTTLGKSGDDDQNGGNNNDGRFNPKNDSRYQRPSDSPAESGSNVIKLPTASKSKTANAARPDPVEILANAMDADNFASADDAAKDGLKQIITAHPEFDYREFMNGSEVAYEMITLGFAQNDRDILKRLLVPAVYDSFNGVMDARDAAKQRIHSRFVGFERVQMKHAELNGSVAHLTVHFVGKLVSTTYDENDHIIDGDEKHIYNTNDVWTFESDMTDEKTSWKLAATAKGA